MSFSSEWDIIVLSARAESVTSKVVTLERCYVNHSMNKLYIPACEL